ncbi:restriction endonuclease subunit S [Arthrobacter sp. MDT2-16]
MEHLGRRAATQDVSKYKVVEPMDVVYNVYLLWLGSIGQNLTGKVGVTSPVYEVFRTNSKVHAPYIGHLLRSPEMTQRYGAIAIGTVPRRRRTPWEDFLDLSVELPPLEDQRRIVDLIGSLDDAFEAAKWTQEVLDRSWWSVASALEQRSQGIPMVSLGDIAEIRGGLTKDKKTEGQTGQVQVPYLRVANVHRRYLDLTEVARVEVSPEKLENLRLAPGDILLNEGGDKDKLGRGAIWAGELNDCIHQNHVFRARITDGNFIPEFVSAWSNSFGQQWFQTHGTQTTGIASISKTTLSKFPVPALPLEQQFEWADVLGAAYQAMEAAARLGESLRATRTELLSVLLSGEHEIPETYDIDTAVQLEPAA